VSQLFPLEYVHMKSAHILLLVLLSGLGAATHAYANNGRLMTAAEYKRFLIEVDVKLPVWEAALKKVDPAKSDISYAVGAQVVQNRDIGLMQVEYARQWAFKQHMKRTVSGEHALEAFLRGIYDAMEAMAITEIAAGVTISAELDVFAPAISKLDITLANDVTARIELLEKGSCP
jgi:hypothetical protein